MMVPTVLAMVICDAVWRDPDTGKATVLGTFTQIAASDLPVELNQLCAYFEVSGHRGTATVRGNLYSTSDDDARIPLDSVELTMSFADRLATLAGTLTFHNVDLPTFGG